MTGYDNHNNGMLFSSMKPTLNRQIAIITILSTGIFFRITSAVYAQPPPVDIATAYPLAFGGTRTLGDYISPLLTTAMVGAGLISFLLIIGAGIAMISSAGNPQQNEKGKNAATAGVMGLGLVFGAFWIIRIIEVLTGIAILTSGL